MGTDFGVRFASYIQESPLPRRLEIIHQLLDIAQSRGGTDIEDCIFRLQIHEQISLAAAAYGKIYSDIGRGAVTVTVDEVAQQIVSTLLIGDTTSNPPQTEQYVESWPVDEAAE